MPLASALSSALADAFSLVFPTWCAGCDAPDVALCPACRAELAPRPLSRTLACGLLVRSALPFDGVAARAIRALKEDGRTELASPLGRALAVVVPPGAVVVPIPSSSAGMRRRGYAVAALLARAGGLRPRRLLRTTRHAEDQRGLGRDERERNVAGVFAARPAAGLRVVIVDDVVTTGATLAAAAGALRAAGAHVVGAATVAATARRGLAGASGLPGSS